MAFSVAGWLVGWLVGGLTCTVGCNDNCCCAFRKTRAKTRKTTTLIITTTTTTTPAATQSGRCAQQPELLLQHIYECLIVCECVCVCVLQKWLPSGFQLGVHIFDSSVLSSYVLPALPLLLLKG